MTDIHRSIALVTNLTLVALLASACGTSPGTTPGAAGTGTPGISVTTAPGVPVDAGAMFGLAPDPRAAGITYQPDVVFLEAGPRAIRSGLSDGLTWNLDRHAAGVERVQPGVVLYATSLVVGRVLQVKEVNADELAVTLAPVDLGDVIKDGHISIDQDIDLGAMGVRTFADAPGLEGQLDPLQVDPIEPEPTQAAWMDRNPGGARMNGVTLASWRQPSTSPATVLDVLPTMPPPYNQGETEWKRGEWSGRIARSGGDITMTVVQQGDLQWHGKVVFHFTTPHLDADIGIIDGEVGDGEIQMRGLRQVALGLQAGSYNGLSDNISEKLELPASFDLPVIVGGIAMNVNVSFKFLVQTAFSAKNSTLEAFGAWDTEGPLSYSRQTGAVEVVWPTITPNPNILDSIKAISVGTNGVVFATSIRLMLGLGAFSFSAGPYAQLATSVSLAGGSSIGFAGAAMQCRQATVTVQGSFGAGLAVSDTVAKGLNAYFKYIGVPQTVETTSYTPLLSEPLYSNAFWMPDTDYCKLAP
jgi:hypothetical protein